MTCIANDYLNAACKEACAKLIERQVEKRDYNITVVDLLYISTLMKLRILIDDLCQIAQIVPFDFLRFSTEVHRRINIAKSFGHFRLNLQTKNTTYQFHGGTNVVVYNASRLEAVVEIVEVQLIDRVRICAERIDGPSNGSRRTASSQIGSSNAVPRLRSRSVKIAYVRGYRRLFLRRIIIAIP